jgi:GH15 family glucan-1,4-alpha-glucosidase
MVATADWIRDELGWGGLVRRYDEDDGLPGREGAFLACSFWLAEALAHQGRDDEAHAAFDSAVATANELGIFTEEHDPERGMATGNVPQALSHLAHISAALALADWPVDSPR